MPTHKPDLIRLAEDGVPGDDIVDIYFSTARPDDVIFPPDLQSFDADPGVSNTAVLGCLDEPAAVFGRELLDPTSDLSHLVAPPLRDCETREERLRDIGSRLANILRSTQQQ